MELQLPHACIYPAMQTEPNSATHVVFVMTTSLDTGLHSAPEAPLLDEAILAMYLCQGIISWPRQQLKTES